MNKGIFITGTDTGVGKTVVTGLLGRYLLDEGVNAVTQKWIQTGCDSVSEDIIAHEKLMGEGSGRFKEFYPDMAPYIFKYPASPHLAASLEGENIDPVKITGSFYRLSDKFDIVLAEGAGGVMVPLNGEMTISDIAGELKLPVLIVAENRLGAINQTLLTVEAVRVRNLKILGIVFNRPSSSGDEFILNDNLKIIEKLSGERVFGELPYSEDIFKLHEDFRTIGKDIWEMIS
ncbi:MAG: dethiobiotin synthase [Candidatus Omnitrophica bacterium]|nr:dethiobiotin synthase [Candidatus Omnitrophota bacterium]